jgi:hypothetical protein
MKERLHAMTQNGLLLDVSESPKKKRILSASFAKNSFFSFTLL